MSRVRRRGAPLYFLVGKRGNRCGGKVENLLLVFHFSIRPRRRSCGNVGISPAFGEISKGLVGRVGSLFFGFPLFPQARHSHSSALLCFRLAGACSIPV